MSTYELPSEYLALWWARKQARIHEIDFGRGARLPLCRKCDQPISGDQWAAMEACPGPTPR